MAEKNTEQEISETKDNAINADPESEENVTNAELPTEDEHEPAAVNKPNTEDVIPTDTDSQTRQNLPSLPPAHKTAEEREARLKEEAMIYKREQTSSLSATTKQMNSVLKLMNNADNLHLVKTGIDTFEMHYARYNTAYDQHTLRLGLDDRMKEENRYMKNNMTFLGFHTNAANWISNAEGQLTSHIDSASSKSGSKLTRSSKSRLSKSRLSRSTRSSSSSAKSKLRAEQLLLAEMKAEMGFIELKYQAKQDEEKIELEIQIAKSEARAAVMKKFVGGSNDIEEVDTTRDLDKKYSEPQDLDRMLTPMSHLDPQAASFVPEPVIQHSLVTRSVPVPEMNSTQAQQKASAHKPETVTVHVPSMIPVHETMNTTARVPEKTSLHIPENVSSSHQTPVRIPESPPVISQPITVNEESMTTCQIPGLGASSYSTQVPTPLPPSNQESMMLQLLETQTQMRLPTPQVPKFSGDPLEYASFIMAFEARILPYVTTEANKLYYLDQQLEGCAKELIQGCIFMDANRGYTEARHLLHMEYGDPFKVPTAYIEKANNWPNLKADDGQGLRTLSHFLTKCTNAMQNITHMNVLNHPTNMQPIVLKLPLYLQNKWRDTVGRLRNRSLDRSVTFHDLMQFVKNEASSVNDPVFSKEALGQRKPKPNASVFATNVPWKVIQCYVCKQDHDIEQCKEFLAMTLCKAHVPTEEQKMLFMLWTQPPFRGMQKETTM